MATKGHLAEWRKSVEAFLEEEIKETDKKTSKQKWQRLQSYDLLVAIDWWQLQCSIGNGLKMFQGVLPLARLGWRPRLSLCWDGGPDNMCAASFLLNHLGMRVSIFFDPPHKLWRCVWQGCHERISVVFLAGIVCNLDRGPWKSESNWQKLQEAMQEYVALSDIICPLFRRLAPRILADRGMDPHNCSSEVLQDLFDSLLDADWMRQKAPRVATTRWGTWHKQWAWLLPLYHEKLLACQACGVLEGWLTKEAQAKYAETLKVVDAGELADTVKQKMAVKEGMRRTQKLRDGVPNQFRLSTLAMMDSGFYFSMRLVHMTSKPFNELYSLWNMTLRSPEATLEHHLSFVQGRNVFFSAIRKCSSPFDFVDDLAALGIEAALSGPAVLKAKDDDPELMDQRDKYKDVWLAIFAQARCFFKGFLPQYLGYPGKFAHLLDPRPEYRAAQWEDMVKDWTAWKSVENTKTGVLRRLGKLTPFRWREVYEIFEWPAMYDMKLTPEVLAVVEQIFKYQGSSLSTEISFQKISDNSRDSKSGRQGAASIWRRPVRDRLLSSEFGFNEINICEVPDDMPIKSELPQSVMRPNYNKQSTTLKDIAGKRPPQWGTFSAANHDALPVHVKFVRWAVDSGYVAKADQCWKSELLHTNYIFKSKGDGKLYLSLVSTPPMIGLLPVQEVKVGKTSGFLKLSFENLLPEWVSLVDINDFMGQPFQFASPLDILRCCGPGEAPDMNGVFGRTDGPCLPLLKFAAKHAFFDIGEFFLNQLARRELNIPLAGTLAEKLLQLVRHILNCDDDTACGILETRIKNIESGADAYAELAQTEECVEHIDDGDQGALKSHLQQVENNKILLNDLRKDITATLSKVAPEFKKRRKMVQTQLPSRDDMYTYDKCRGLLSEEHRGEAQEGLLQWAMAGVVAEVPGIALAQLVKVMGSPQSQGLLARPLARHLGDGDPSR